MEGTDAVEDKTRLRVKLGAAEIEYEGGAASLEKLVMPMVAKMVQLVESHTDLQRPSSPLQIEAEASKPTTQARHGGFNYTTDTIAVAMNAQNAPDLAIAGCAHLALVKMKDRFTRKEILEEMRTAPSFFNKNMSKNLSQTLSTLTGSSKLRLVAEDTYALSNNEKTRLEQVFAQIK